MKLSRLAPHISVLLLQALLRVCCLDLVVCQLDSRLSVFN